MLRRSVVSFLFLSLAGCSILPERPPLKFYGLILDTPPKASSANRLNASLVINPPEVASPFESTKFFILGKDERFYASDINRFVSQPSDLIGNSLRSWLDAVGPWKTILPPNSINVGNYQMTVFLQSFYADTRGDTGFTNISLEITVVQTKDGKLAFQKMFNQKTPIKEETAAALIQSYREGLTTIYTELTNDLNASFLKR